MTPARGSGRLPFRWPWRTADAVRQEVDDELRFHLDQRAQELVALGVEPGAAEAQAAREFGDLESTRRALQKGDLAHERGRRRHEWLHDLSLDVRYALRGIRRSPGFAAATIITLGLGLGANTAVFTLVNSILLRPLPYHESEHLYTAVESDSAGSLRLISYPTFRDWAEEQDLFDGMSMQRGLAATLKGNEGSEIVLTAYVSDGFFPLLGTPPALGRWFQPDDERAGAEAIAVLSYALWQRRFGGDPGIIGRTLAFAQGPATVIGVMPVGFAFPSWANVWLPIQALPPSERNFLIRRDLHVDSRVIVRVRRDRPLPVVQARMNALAQRLAAVYPAESGRFKSVSLQPLNTQVIGNTGQVLFLFTGAVACVLLIACANLANLSLVRSLGRGREIAIRAALGAGRARVVRQLLTEAGVLAVAGGTLGLLIAYGSVEWAKAATESILPRVDEVQLDGRVMGFMLALSALSVLAFGLWPALRASSPNLAEGLRDRSAAGAGPSARVGRAVLVSVQVALAVMLLAGAGLLIRSALAVNRIDPGFNPRGLAIFRINPPSPRYDESARAALLYRQLAEAAAAIPGVSAVTLSNHVPMHGASMPTRVIPEGNLDDPSTQPTANLRTVSPGYFQTVETPVVRGRGFTEADMTSSATAILVNETLAKQLWPGDGVIGRRLTVLKAAQGRADFQQPVSGDVVGVVRDVRHFGLEFATPAEVYLPYPVNVWGSMFLVARTSRDPHLLLPTLRKAILSVDPDIPVVGTDTFAVVDDLFAAIGAARRLNTILLGIFAGAALLLSVVGLYGVMAYSVCERRRDLGVRLALGAEPGRLMRSVIGEGLRLTLVGVVVGLVGAWAASGLLRSLVFSISTTDGATFVAAPILLLAVGVAATLLPARRAARVDSLEVLRSD